MQHHAQLAGDGELFGYEEGDNVLAGEAAALPGGSVSHAEDGLGALDTGEAPALVVPPVVV